MLAGALPLAALAAGEQRVRAVRAALRLDAPADSDIAVPALALAAVCALLGVAAAQPALQSIDTARVRADAEAMFVLDTSRSMSAASSADGPTRMERAQLVARRLRSAVPDVPAGAATLTDRLLPNLLPDADAAAFNSTVSRAIGVEKPPPRGSEVIATTFDPLAGIATDGFFSRQARRRVLIVLTDGESRPFSASGVARALGRGPGISLLLVHVWAADERVFGQGGRVEDAYRPNERSRAVLEALAAAADGAVYAENDGAAVDALRRAAGRGPTAERGRALKTTPLAPYVAASALVPLLLVLRRRNLVASGNPLSPIRT